MTAHETPTFTDLHNLYVQIFPHRPAPGHHGAQSENNTRMKRALSWLEQSHAAEAADKRFLFAWVAFNAAYADDKFFATQRRGDEKTKIKTFLCKVIKRDANNRLGRVLPLHGEKFRKIMRDRFLFLPFWQAEYPRKKDKPWRQAFLDESEKLHMALRGEHLTKSNVRCILPPVFFRLYTLRNQIMHGCASSNSTFNIESLKAGNGILEICIPEILHVMLAAMQRQHDVNWGRVEYPPYLADADATDASPPCRK